MVNLAANSYYSDALELESPKSMPLSSLYSSYRRSLLFCLLLNVSIMAISPRSALKFFETIGKLKTLKRTGWVNNDIPLPESVADHMYRMSMICFMVTDPLINKDRLLKVCMMHDVAEAVVGDITPYDGVTKEEKRKLVSNLVPYIPNIPCIHYIHYTYYRHM